MPPSSLGSSSQPPSTGLCLLSVLLESHGQQPLQLPWLAVDGQIAQPWQRPAQGCDRVDIHPLTASNHGVDDSQSLATDVTASEQPVLPPTTDNPKLPLSQVVRQEDAGEGVLGEVVAQHQVAAIAH